MLFGYARVSKGDDQSNALQKKALQEAGVERIFSESASGGRWDRPQLHKMLEQLRQSDTVIVWKLDRLSRSLKDLLLIMEKIDAAKAHFSSITEAIDTSTPAGRMMMNMVGTFAEARACHDSRTHQRRSPSRPCRAACWREAQETYSHPTCRYCTERPVGT